MSEAFENQPFPRAPLLAAAALIGATFLIVMGARVADVGRSQTLPAAPIASRELLFQDRSDGSVAVLDARTSTTIEVLDRGSNGFVRATMRGLARERRSRGLGSGIPFRLTARADGALTLEDLGTGRLVELEAFGRTNSGAFARFLTLSPDQHSQVGSGE